MKFSRHTAGLILQLLLLLLVVLVVLSPTAPLYEPVPARDQGVYLYVGQQILDGKIPYRDVWDHKGPLVYYINALGLWLTDSIWGVWILEAVSLFLAAMLCFLSLRMAFDSPTAFSTVILWLAAFPYVADHGNSVEEYSLPFQFAAVYFFLRAQNSKDWWNEFWIGVTAALTFSLRPNNIGLHLAIGLILVADLMWSANKERFQPFKRILAATTGSGVVFVVIAVYFAVNQALGDLFDQVFVFNYYYSQLEALTWSAITKGYELMPDLVALSIGGLAGALIYLSRRERDLPSRLAWLALAAAPIQLYLSLLSGRKYMHYYIAWMPVLALLTGLLIFAIGHWGGKLFRAESFRKPLSLILAIGLIFTFGWRPIVGRLPKLNWVAQSTWEQKALPRLDYSAVEPVNYVLSYTQPADYVLIWGNASVYNFLTKRESPSRFAYTYAFGVPTYATEAMADELLTELAAKKPLILDASRGDKNIRAIASPLWDDVPATQRVMRFIEENYIEADTVGEDRWQVWIPK